MMRSLEFLYDEYLFLDVEHYLDGYLLSKIPLLKKLKIREFYTLKLLLSNLTDKNNPRVAKNSEDLFFLPEYSYTKTAPYFEASVGLYNILKLFKVEAVRRFSYLDHPKTNKWGVRFGIQIGF